MGAQGSAIRGYLTPEDACLGDEFLTQGHVIREVEDRGALDRLRTAVVAMTAQYLDIRAPGDASDFLNGIHEHIDAADLNDLRLTVFNGLNGSDSVREAYFSLTRTVLESLVGNELAMQRRVNLSIQLPNDDSSLLPVHADVWSGDSPFEVVVWLPLVDCFGTKAMFLLPPEANREAAQKLGGFDGRSAEDLFSSIESDVKWIEIPFGSALIFSQNLMHGNRVNRENESRWSMNCRYKSLFSPYAGKRLGEFFEPITVRPATRIGMDYQLPEGFEE